MSVRGKVRGILLGFLASLLAASLATLATEATAEENIHTPAVSWLFTATDLDLPKGKSDQENISEFQHSVALRNGTLANMAAQENCWDSAPSAGPDEYLTIVDVSVSLDLFRNATHSCGTQWIRDNYFVQVSIDPIYGMASETLYTPSAGFTGEDSFEYELCQIVVLRSLTNSAQTSCTGSALVTIQVVDCFVVPTLGSDSYSTLVNTSVSINLFRNANHPCGSTWIRDQYRVQSLSPPTNGTESSSVYTPNAEFTGVDSMEYRLCPINASILFECTGFAVVTINVAAIPPTANASGPYFSHLGDSILFSSAGSSDADGSIVSYSWDFGDGTQSTVANPVHTYDGFGLFDVTLTVKDNHGGQDSDTASARVNGPPSVSAGGPYTAAPGQPVTFVGEVTDPEEGALSYLWDFGDDTTSSEPRPTHAYAASGEYVVKLTVTDEFIAISSSTAAVSINAAPSTAGFTQQAVAGQSVEFGLEAGASDSDGVIASWRIVSGPAIGTVSVLGSLRGEYTAPADACGETSTFTFVVVDDDGAESPGATGTFAIAECPTVVPDSVQDGMDGVVLVDVLANDNFPAGVDVDSISVVEPPTNGTATQELEKIRYESQSDFQGEDTFTYEACDLLGQCRQAEVTITVSFVTQADGGTGGEMSPVVGWPEVVATGGAVGGGALLVGWRRRRFEGNPCTDQVVGAAMDPCPGERETVSQSTNNSETARERVSDLEGRYQEAKRKLTDLESELARCIKSNSSTMGLPLLLGAGGSDETANIPSGDFGLLAISNPHAPMADGGVSGWWTARSTPVDIIVIADSAQFGIDPDTPTGNLLMDLGTLATAFCAHMLVTAQGIEALLPDSVSVSGFRPSALVAVVTDPTDEGVLSNAISAIKAWLIKHELNPESVIAANVDGALTLVDIAAIRRNLASAESRPLRGIPFGAVTSRNPCSEIQASADAKQAEVEQLHSDLAEARSERQAAEDRESDAAESLRECECRAVPGASTPDKAHVEEDSDASRWFLVKNQNPNAPKRANGKRGWYRTTRTAPIDGIVVHTVRLYRSAGGTLAEVSAANTAGYFTVNTKAHAASAHVIIDATGVIRLIPDSYKSFHAINSNNRGLGLEIAYWADQWGTSRAIEEAIIRNAAVWCALKVAAYNIPTVRLTREEWAAGGRGFVSHADADPTPGRKTDPGDKFNWNDFLSQVAAFTGNKREP